MVKPVRTKWTEHICFMREIRHLSKLFEGRKRMIQFAIDER